MAIIGWGRCAIYVKDLDASEQKWEKQATPVENSTQLTPTKGSKQEAKIEGGENEDVRYGTNNYALAYQIRKAKGRKPVIEHVDGVVAHNYAVVVIPEDPEVPSGLYIASSAVSVEDSFSTQEGGADLFTHDALKPSDGSRLVKWGVFTVTDNGGTITIKAKANEGDFTTETTL